MLMFYSRCDNVRSLRMTNVFSIDVEAVIEDVVLVVSSSESSSIFTLSLWYIGDKS